MVATNVPEPWRVTTSPSSRSLVNARTTVTRLTFSRTGERPLRGQAHTGAKLPVGDASPERGRHLVGNGRARPRVRA